MSDFKASIRKLDQEAGRIKAALQDQILALPDNPDITRLGESGKCFSIPFSKLGQTWSAEFHDFRLQYDALLCVVEQADLLKLPFKLSKILHDGKLKAGGKIITLNPVVIKALAAILAGEGGQNGL